MITHGREVPLRFDHNHMAIVDYRKVADELDRALLVAVEQRDSAWKLLRRIADKAEDATTKEILARDFLRQYDAHTSMGSHSHHHSITSNL